MALFSRTTKLRARRIFRRRKKEVEELTYQADEQLEQHFIKRLSRLAAVRRFVFGWLALFFLIAFCLIVQTRALGTYYQSPKPTSGGNFTEGLVGSFTNANPLYATGAANRAVNRLVFSSLFSFDRNNKLTGELAQKWDLDQNETRYTVTLKPDILWQDGEPFTADDVVFTYNTIQNTDAKSALYSSWQGIKVSRLNDRQVAFDLPNPLSSFPYSMTNGIVPSHLLSKIPPDQLRSANFNVMPIGTGPFKWRSIDVIGGNSATREQRIVFIANQKYFDGKPKMDSFTLRTFLNENRLLKSFESKELNAMSGLDMVPADFKKDQNVTVYNTQLNSAVMVFLNTSHEQLKDVQVRKALTAAVSPKVIQSGLQFPSSIVDEPLLRGQLGYEGTITQIPFDEVAANNLLDAAGWKRGPDGYRLKDGMPLNISLRSQSTEDYMAVTRLIQKQWNKVGVRVETRYFSSDDIQTTVIAGHDYDALLYGISIGVDPDVFAYWHSSQASISSSGHLNLSEYKSTAADQALEAGRLRSDPALRVLKYRSFLDAWRNDAPAIGLYQPQYLYVTRGPIYGYQRAAMNGGGDRFDNVAQWMIRLQNQDK